MSKKSGDRRPYLKPVTRIELSEQNIKLRFLLLVILLAIGAVALVAGVKELVSVEPGWQEVEVASDQVNCGLEFVLMYDFSEYGNSASLASKQVTAAYSSAMEEASVIFSASVEDPSVGNLWMLNRNVNQALELEPALYAALELLQEAQNRCIYLAPVYAEYNRIFLCQTEQEAMLRDPTYQPELQPYLQQLAACAADPEAVDIVLMENNRAMLKVSEAYLAFAQEQGIEDFVDLGWMTNAFVADYLADALTKAGFTNGYLSSYDGFTRNLDGRGNAYSVNLFDRLGTDIYMPARLDYTGPMALVTLRDFPMSDQDKWHYFAYSDGRITSVYIDPADGMSKSSVSSLTGWGENAGCAELLLDMIPAFLTEEFEKTALEEASEQGRGFLWFRDRQVETVGSIPSLTVLDESYSMKAK